MSPAYLLSLWRERWARQGEAELDRPFSSGAVAKWLNKLPEGQWASRLITIGFVVVLSLSFQWFAVQVVFSLNGQITYAILLAGLLIFLRRLTGDFVGFFLWLITLNVTVQYFYWRLTKTLVFRSDPELLLSMLICILEICVAIFWLIQAFQSENRVEEKWHAILAKLSKFLHFYSPVVLGFCLLIPSIFLLGRFQIISGPIDWWVPLALPVCLFYCVVQERQQSVFRKSLVMATREGLLAIYMFIRTIFSFINASVRHPHLFFRYSFFSSTQSQCLKAVVLFTCRVAFIFLNSAAFFVGLGRLFGLSFQTDTLLLTLLSLFNCGLLFSRWAVRHEAQHVQIFLEKVRIQNTVIKAGSGRTLVAKIVNFPSETLRISVPASSSVLDEVHHNQNLVLQISHSDNSYNLTAQAVHKEAGFLLVKIAPSSLDEWKKLSSILLARPADWPGWLPKRDADQILPIWLSQKLRAIPAWIVDSLTKLAGLMKLEMLFAFLKARVSK